MPRVSGVYWFNLAYRARRTPRATDGFRARDAISTRRITKKPRGKWRSRVARIGFTPCRHDAASEKSEKERRQERLRYQGGKDCDSECASLRMKNRQKSAGKSACATEAAWICDPGVGACEWCSLRGRTTIGRSLLAETSTGGMTGAGSTWSLRNRMY